MGTPKKAAAPKTAPAQPKAVAPAKNVVKVGDTCQYTPGENDHQLSGPGPFAAIITKVIENGSVNLQVFPDTITGPFYYSNVPAGSGPHTWA